MTKKIRVVAMATILLAGIGSVYTSQNRNNFSILTMENIEALSSNEAGVKCPDGCSSIGFGFNKILDCHCEYKSLSSCNKWGC